MNKTNVSIIIAILVIISGFFIFSPKSNREVSPSMTQSEIMQIEKSEAMEKNLQSEPRAEVASQDKMSDEKMSSDNLVKGSYELYSPEKIEKASNGKVVLFFRASWCPSCRTLDADIKAHNQDIPAGVIILDVDYDKYVDLKKKYGVTYQHTLVQVDQSGGLITKWSGGATLSSVLSKIQ